MTACRTPEQERASRAWEAVQKRSDCEDFARGCKRTVTRIMNSGLLPALAYLEAKPDECTGLSCLLAEHVQRLRIVPPGTDAAGLLKRLVEGDAATLRRATAETVAYLGWLARLAEGKAKG